MKLYREVPIEEYKSIADKCFRITEPYKDGDELPSQASVSRTFDVVAIEIREDEVESIIEDYVEAVGSDGSWPIIVGSNFCAKAIIDKLKGK